MILLFNFLPPNHVNRQVWCIASSIATRLSSHFFASMAKASSVFQSTLLPSFSPLHQLRNQNFTLSFPPLPVSRCRPGIHCSVSAGETTRRSVEEVPDISWGCEIDSVENATSLQKWLSDSGLPPQKMSIDRVDIGERGLVASQNLRKGEKLLFVPPSLVISADSVSLHS